jgi:hypothetical protein
MIHDWAMNDVIWYSRFAVLVGALVLLVQAVAGRAQGLVTVVAVLLLCIGFLVFIAALSFQGWSSRSAPQTGETTVIETRDATEPEDSSATPEPVEVEE